MVFGPLRKYWYLVLGLTLITAVLAGQQRQESYESRARLLLKLGDDFLESASGPNARNTGRIQLAEAVNTDVQILTSHDQFQKVVEELGADSFRTEGSDGEALAAEDAVATLRSGLNVRSVENSAVIHLSYAHPDPERAKLVLSTLIDVYLRERGRILGRGEGDALERIRDEALESYVDTRDAHERMLGGTSMQDAEATLAMLREQQMRLRSDIRDTRRQLAEDRRELAVIDSEIDKQPARKEIFTEPRVSASLERAQNRLVELRVEEQQLLGKYTEASRPVSRMRKEIAELERIIRDERGVGSDPILRTGNNPIRDTLELRKAELAVSVAGAEARLEALTEQEAELRAELSELEKRYVEAEKLHDALVLARSRYQDVDQQYLEHRIWADSAAVRETNVRVIERPALPLGASGLPASARYLLGAAIGFLAGWALAVWIALLRTREHRSTGMPRRWGDLADPESSEELLRARRPPEALAERRPVQRAELLPVLGEFRSTGTGGRR